MSDKRFEQIVAGCVLAGTAVTAYVHGMIYESVAAIIVGIIAVGAIEYAKRKNLKL